MNTTAENTRHAGTGDFLVGLVQVILNPRQGWNDAAKDNFSVRDLLVRGFCPFLALVAVTAIIPAFYRSSITLIDAVIKGVVDFAGYFISVYICQFLLVWAMDRWVGPRRSDTHRSMTYVIYTIASMSFITLLDNVFPVDLALLSFLPLYVIYIIWKGSLYMSVPEDRNVQFMACALCTLFFPPYVLGYFLSLLV